jgi:hypothetical protein
MEFNSPKFGVVCWIYIVLTHWNNRPPVDMSLYSLYYPDPDPTSICPFFMMLRFWLSSNTYRFFSLLFDPIRLEPAICRTRSEYANQ